MNQVMLAGLEVRRMQQHEHTYELVASRCTPHNALCRLHTCHFRASCLSIFEKCACSQPLPCWSPPQTHVCVLQTSLDLIEQGYEVHVIVDGVSSQRLGDRAVAIQVSNRLQRTQRRFCSNSSNIQRATKAAGALHGRSVI